MSQVEVDKIIPQSGTTLTIGDSGDTIAIASGATLSGSISGITNLTITGDLTVDTDTLYVDSTNNRVGIGTSSPESELHIADTGSNAVVRIEGATSGESNIFFDDTTNNVGALRYLHSSDAMTFTTNAGERMRIDSSGNVLVGKTSANTSTVGAELRPDGLGSFTRTGTYAITATRTTNDGDIISIRKDGTVIGAIGVSNSDNLYVDGVVSGHGGISFGSTSWVPRSGGAFADNTVDIGNNGNFIKDIHVKGGILFGSTGTANKLDDYEEGTWTPIYTTSGTDFTSVTYDFRRTHYTKIGRQVTCTLSMRTDAITKGSASGTVRLGGLPFQAHNEDAYEAVAIGGNFAVNNPSGIRILTSTTVANLQKGYNNGSILVSDMGTGTNANFIALVFTYFTD